MSVTHPLAPLAAELAARAVRYVLIGVSAANMYGPHGQAVFITNDFDLFLPPEPENLVRSWEACAIDVTALFDESQSSRALHITGGGE